jgi:general secretion pathway protein C
VIKNKITKKQKLYAQGDIIQDAKLKWVQRDQVVISRQGRDEILKVQNPESHPISPNLDVSPSTAEQSVPSIHKVLLRSQLEKKLRNVHDLISQIRVTPHREEGSDKGLLLTRILPHTIFERMGLRNHDIVTRIDGHKIRSVADAIKLYNNLIYAKTLTIQLKRYGSLQNLTYTIQ